MKALRANAAMYRLPSPAVRAGTVRRCASSSSPPPPPPPPPPGGSGGAGAGAGGPLPPPGAQWWWRALQVCAGVLTTAGVAAAALPSVLNTQWGLQRAMELVNTRMPGRVEVAEARLSWTGPCELQCVKVYDSPRGGQILLHLNKVSTAASLWQLLTGNSGFNLVISKPWINAIYDPRVSDFKLITFAEKVGLLNAPPPPPRRQSSQQQQQPAAGNGSGNGSGNSRLVQALARVNSKMGFNADVRLGGVNLVVADGMLLVAEEVRQIMGPAVHVTGAFGEKELREWASELGLDVQWAVIKPAAASAYSASAADLRPPPAVMQRPAAYRPGMMQVHSEHFTGEVRLWQAEDHSLLHQPATAQLDLTPALSRLGLGSANPLLGDVAQVGGGERLQVAFSPEGGRLPYQAATVEMAPTTLLLGPSSIAAGLLGELGLHGLSPATAIAAAGAIAAAKGAAGREGAAAAAAASSSPASLQAEVSRMRVHFRRDAELRTERVDMRIGAAAGAAGAASSSGSDNDNSNNNNSGSGGVRVALWGSADLQKDQLDFTLGVAPGPLLERLGLGGDAGLPEGLLLLVPLRGPVSAPRYDVGGAVVRLGQLAARQKATQWAERQEQRRENGEGGVAAGLGALLSAVAPPGELLAGLERQLQEDLARIPPPLEA
ncbi:hypothetical protein Agub_g13104 [Astrephomene gubernaculifera]|uniref:Uncharacterized protein n=1 Tax=Astrephomene gubernaculifera TaxID=47775 RepID=A0AAD3DZA9_9CHLO|nr:hypothetical protein Agub_g13104 [Astrephomene gubernaculifera]